MIRFGLIGSGWRAEFYTRIAALMPDTFELTSVMVRDPAKGDAFAAKHHVRVVHTLDDVLADRPEFVVVSVRKGCAADPVLRLCEAGMPVLCETPPVNDMEGLTFLWDSVRTLGGNVQVAEQYLWQPLYAAYTSMLQSGLIGRVENVSLSAVHAYHAASIIRHWLGAGFGNCTLCGKSYSFDITKTGSREGFCFTGEMTRGRRDRLTFEFDGGGVAFFDFDGTQYHSSIRTRHWNVQGTRGEIDDLTIRYLTEDNIPVTQTLNRVDLGVWNNQEWAHYGITLGDRYVYRSPFPTARLNDDELAVACCLSAMHGQVTAGTPCYSLAEALQDTYLSLLMEQALAHPLQQVTSQRMPWAGA